MKNTKLFTSLAIAALAATFTFTSCEKTPVGPDYTLAVVDFEAANLSSEGYLVNDTYEEKGLTFVHNYTVNPGGSDYWNGFAVSNKTDETTPGMANQYSVYAASGAGGSAKFAVACEFEGAVVEFAEGEAYEMEYAYINNSTYVYLAIKDGNDGFGAVKGPFETGDWFRLTATGYDAEGGKTAEKEIYLADYRNGKTFIMSEWTKVDLSSLGKVNKVAFTLWSTDTGDFGGTEYMNTPGYFCLDNLAYRVYAE